MKRVYGIFTNDAMLMPVVEMIDGEEEPLMGIYATREKAEEYIARHGNMHKWALVYPLDIIE